MAVDFQLGGEVRDDKGKGASRRLRREGKVPAILYGGGEEPLSLTLDHNEILRNLENDAFYSHILKVKIGRKSHQAVLKDIQRHPAKLQVMHLDLQRVKANESIRVHVPLHFLNGDTAPGVKEGGVASHHIVDVEIDCLPKHLPEFIEVDLGALNLGDVVHLGDLVLPEGVSLVALSHGDENDAARQVASVHTVRVAAEPEEDEAQEAEATDADDAAEKGSEGESEDKS